MKANMGSVDKIVRLLIAALFIILYITGVVTGLLGTILLILAVVLALTSLISFCPLYAIFGIRTNKKQG